MEPRIQYAQTEDGVSIAFSTLGEGMPLVWIPPIGTSHLQLHWHIPELRRFAERLVEKRTLVTYDARGSGLSDREVTNISFETLLMDVETVVDHFGLGKFALWGSTTGGLPAIAYAARHPDRVSHLLLWSAFARGSDYWQSSRIQAALRIADTDWEMFTETVAHTAFGWSEGELAHRMATYLRECMTQEAFRAFGRALGAADVTALLAQIRSPTLVLHRRQHPFVDVATARGLASRIPSARLALLEGSSDQPHLDDWQAVIAAIDEFLGESDEAAPVAQAPAARDVYAILFTDVESSTALTQRLGDAEAQELVRIHNAIVRDALQAHGGSEIKHTGDGIMASFPSASQALQCAVAIQQAVEQQGDTALRVRIGLNAGEPVAEEQDLFGASVQLARRVCDHAEPGQIVAADVVRQLATGKGFLFSDLGDAVPKGFEEPVRLYEVRWQD